MSPSFCQASLRIEERVAEQDWGLIAVDSDLPLWDGSLQCSLEISEFTWPCAAGKDPGTSAGDEGNVCLKLSTRTPTANLEPKHAC